MQKFAPCLWYDQNAEEAATFYTGLFPDSHIDVITHSPGGSGNPIPKGTLLTIRFTLCGQEFNALNGGPIFHFTPAVSLFVSCANEAEFDRLWAQLRFGGGVLMEPMALPISPKFGWLADKYGLSWQLMVGQTPQRITPFLLFVGAQYGRAEEAIRFYTSLFGGHLDSIQHHGHGGEDREGTVQLASFSLAKDHFMASDSGYPHAFTFTEANSFFIYCKDQSEIDTLWEALTAKGGEEQPCGWLKDRFGVSWQLVPREMETLMSDAHPEKSERVAQALFKMTKIDVAALWAAYNGA